MSQEIDRQSDDLWRRANVHCQRWVEPFLDSPWACIMWYRHTEVSKVCPGSHAPLDERYYRPLQIFLCHSCITVPHLANQKLHGV